MSRIYFSPSSVTDLKTTLSNSITLANAIFWTSFYEMHSQLAQDADNTKSRISDSVAKSLGYKDWKEYISSSYPTVDSHLNPEIIDSIIDFQIIDSSIDLAIEDWSKNPLDLGVSVKEFKPSRMKLYNRCAVVFGYNNWNELVETSKSRENLLLEPIFVHQEERLQKSLVDVFTDLFCEFLPLPDVTSVHYFAYVSAREAAFLIANAIVLHPNEKHDETGLAEAFLNIDPETFDGKGLIVAGMEPNMLEIALVCNFEQLLPNFIYKKSDEAMNKALDSYHLPMILDLYKANSKVARFGYEPPKFAYRLELCNPDKKHAFAGVMSLISWFSERGLVRFSRYNEQRNNFLKTGMKAEEIEYLFSENKTKH